MATKQRRTADTSEEADWSFLRRLLIGLAVVALAYGLWRISGVLLLIFAAVLLAIVLSLIAGLMSRYLAVPERWSVTVAIIVLVLILGGFLVFFGAQVTGQIRHVMDQLPSAFDRLGGLLNISNASERLEQALTSETGGHVLIRTLGISYTVLGVLGDIVVVLVGAAYLAANPSLYRHGIVKLFAPEQRERITDAMTAVGDALRHWFAGQVVSMLGVGILSGTAFWLIGLPSPLALGIIAGLTNFIPLLGPILGALPAVLLAFTVDPTAALWTVAAVIAIQQIEGNLVMPMVQQRAVSLPPAVTIFALVIFGVMFGWLGIILAVPLAVAIMVLVERLWVEDALEQ